ncbi:NAD(P)/FAD-dependent oxidoreductase [Brucella sp. IR073]|uniref:NAD(P)/FAD-dependent oxidoreductase n=1 Tax=unclassified Brucella TaxID=2632610 RepID=UPI003B9808FB
MEIGSDVLIIGGGIQGAAAAFYLAREGVSVHVLEKDYVGRHASGVNAGGVRTLNRHFAELPLSVAAKAIWLNIEELLGEDCGFLPVGQIRVAETEQDLEHLRTRAQAVSQLGLPYAEEIIDRHELYERLPALVSGCVGAALVANDGYANPYRTTVAFKLAAVRAGATFHEKMAAVAITRKDGGWTVTTGNRSRFRALVLLNCAGAWGARIAEQLGDKVPLAPNGSMLMVTARLPKMVAPVVGAVRRSLSFKQFANGTVLIGGGHRAPVDIDHNETKVSLPGLAKAARIAIELFPFMAKAKIVRFWSGIEGFMPDGLPVIGPSLSSPNAYHAFGFCAHGFQLGPAVGAVLAELAIYGTSCTAIDAFSIDRLTRSAAKV